MGEVVRRQYNHYCGQLYTSRCKSVKEIVVIAVFPMRIVDWSPDYFQQKQPLCVQTGTQCGLINLKGNSNNFKE